RDERDLEGKVAVITGGSRGLGFLIARELGREGCRVVIGARDPEELERAYEALRFDGATVHAVACDVRRRESAEDLIAEARLVYGGVDILVNNAGIIQVASLETLDEDVFQDAMDT